MPHWRWVIISVLLLQHVCMLTTLTLINTTIQYYIQGTLQQEQEEDDEWFMILSCVINVATAGVAISSLSSFSITTSLTTSDIIVSITFIPAEVKKKWTVLCMHEVAKSSSWDDHAPDWWLILVSPWWCPPSSISFGALERRVTTNRRRDRPTVWPSVWWTWTSCWKIWDDDR